MNNVQAYDSSGNYVSFIALNNNNNPFPPSFLQSIGFNNTNPNGYRLQSVDFNEKTRKATIYITYSEECRVIEKYKQVDYQKIPIYKTKIKDKNVTEKLFLSDAVVDKLEEHKSEPIRSLAFEIISAIPFFQNNVNLQPIWYIERKINTKKQSTTKSFYKKYSEQLSALKQENTNANNEMAKLKYNIFALQKTLNDLYTEREKHTKHLNKLYKHKIVLFRNPRIKRCQKKLSVVGSLIAKLENDVSSLQQQVSFHLSVISNAQNKLDSLNNVVNKKLSELNFASESALEKLYSSRQNRESIIVTDDDFVFIEEVNSAPIEETIMGCYVIRNNINNKYYVGQSYNVRGRLKQHFNGSIPKNHHFAEDYYTTPQELRSKLFSVKILPQTEYETLNEMEKRLIAEYNSYKNGYNATCGNEP